MSLSSVLSSSSKVTPSKGRNQNNSSAVGDHGQPDPTAGGGQVADDIETADIKQGAKESRATRKPVSQSHLSPKIN